MKKGGKGRKERKGKKGKKLYTRDRKQPVLKLNFPSDIDLAIIFNMPFSYSPAHMPSKTQFISWQSKSQVVSWQSKQRSKHYQCTDARVESRDFPVYQQYHSFKKGLARCFNGSLHAVRYTSYQTYLDWQEINTSVYERNGWTYQLHGINT